MKHLKIEKGKSASVHEPLMFQELSNGSERCCNDVNDADFFFQPVIGALHTTCLLK